MRSETVRRKFFLGLLLGASMVISSGCYNGEELVERIRSKAIRTRLEEIDLGQYRITLPRDSKSNEMIEVRIHMFAHAARHRLSSLERELKEKDFLIQDNMLTTFRAFKNEDLEDPELTYLRKTVLETVNSTLHEPLLSSLGMYDFQISRH